MNNRFVRVILLNRCVLLRVAASLCSVRASADSVFIPQHWWLVGPYACYSTADFEAVAPIENAPNNVAKENRWNRVMAVAGYELRARYVTAVAAGALDVASVAGDPAPGACAYSGFRVKAEQAGDATLVLCSTGPARWFLNNKLVSQSLQADESRVPVKLREGLNGVLVKSWNPTGRPAWSVACAIESPLATLSFEDSGQAWALPEPGVGRRNVALWSEGSRGAVSSVAWRGFPVDERGLSPLNDGRRAGSPGAVWTSLEVDPLPQWAWLRFPGLRKIDSAVIYTTAGDRRPLELVGECTHDGGATFQRLFELKEPTVDPKDSSVKAQFPAVVTDNLRVCVKRAALPESAAQQTAVLAEIEVYGEDAPGAGSLSAVSTKPVPEVRTQLQPDRAYRPSIKQGVAAVEIATPWYRLTLDRARPRIVKMSVDALGRGEFPIELLRPAGGAMAQLTPLFDAPRIAQDGALEMDGNVARYPAVEVATGVRLAVALRFTEKVFQVELASASARRVPLQGGVFRFDFDFWQTPTAFFGRSSDPAHVISLPCYMHAPDAGTCRVSVSGDGAVLRQRSNSDLWDLSTRHLIDIAPSWSASADDRCSAIPAGTWRSTLRFEVGEPAMAFADAVSGEPCLSGMPRWALNIAQWRSGKRVLCNNVVGVNCPLSLQFYAEMAVYAPPLADGVSVMDLVAASVDRYLDGVGGHLMWHGYKVEVTPPGKWHASLETGGFLLNSAWFAVRTLGGRPLLDRWLPRLESLAGHLEAHDTDGDGIVDSGDRGHWFDNYALPEGVKEAHSTAANYDAFRHLAELEALAGRNEKAAHYRARAKLIKDNYLRTFFNPETGVIGGWRDKQGKLHDRIFPWVNGYAICAGLVSDEQANQILDRLMAKMKEIGFTQYQYGLPTNLLPMGKDEMSHGYREWQGYMNGSITPPYSTYFIMALYKLGRRKEAAQMLWPQIASFDKGTFNAGVCIPHMKPRNPVGSAFYYWDGTRSNGVGYLPENWHAYAGIYAGHLGIRFDEKGYSLEPWSPLKGQRVRCGLPVMGKLQEFVE